MTAMKATKKAMLSSLLALVLCFAMLLGTTFAWFTDSAVSSDNKIKAGTLDVQLYKWTGTDASEEITALSDPLFTEDTIWEPGRTEVVYLSIKNNGTLDLKYKVALETKEVSAHDLREVMSYAITPDAEYGEVTGWLQNGETEETLDTEEAITVATENVALEAGAEHFFALSVHMDEEAGNEYMGESIAFDIRVLAGQLASEEDGFGNPNYDTDAEYDHVGTASVGAFAEGQSAQELNVMDKDGQKIASIILPAAAAKDDAQGHNASVAPSNYKANINVATGLKTQAYDISVSGVKEGNTAGIKVSLALEPGMNPDTVKVYHYDTEITSTYNPENGYVTFEVTDFSPFTFVYDAESEYVAPEIPPVTDEEENDLPKANVVNSPEYENVALDWRSYDTWSPTEGLDSMLEAAYTFSCVDTLETAKLNPYAYWYCDFYVMLDKDLGANQIFLGGNYGSFGWVGFHNGDLTLSAGTEIPLLGSVTNNPWTYLDVVQNVGTFICGVGDVDDALADATFTVMLRLTNPEDETEFYNVATINYTFTKTVTTGEELQDAINNGISNITLGGDIDLSEGLVIPGNN